MRCNHSWYRCQSMSNVAAARSQSMSHEMGGVTTVHTFLNLERRQVGVPVFIARRGGLEGP